MARLYLGTSGWSYSEWEGVFYRRREGKLRYYASVFNTVEMDSSFYTCPTPDLVGRLARALPSGFRMSVKMPGSITHRRMLGRMGGVSSELDAFLEAVRPLRSAGKLGAVLIQLPPGLERDDELLGKFLDSLDRSFRYAVEFRHPSWLCRDVLRILEEHEVAYTIVDEPLLPPKTHVTTDFAYIRWHGRGSRPWYNYRYSDRELMEWVPRVKRLMDTVDTIYGYFNNHFRAYAVESCLKMMLMLGVGGERERRLLEEVSRRIDAGRAATQPVDPAKLASMSTLEMLAKLTDRERLRRGVAIPRGEVKVSGEGGVLEAEVRGYRLVVDLENRVLAHDCADWTRMAPGKRLCKHFVRLFTAMPEARAREILRDVLANIDSWDFRILAAGEED